MTVLTTGGVGRDLLVGEFCSDTSREGVSSVSGDSLLVKVTEIEELKFDGYHVEKRMDGWLNK